MVLPHLLTRIAQTLVWEQDNSTGRKAQNRTWPDLLKDEHDVAVFEVCVT